MENLIPPPPTPPIASILKEPLRGDAVPAGHPTRRRVAMSPASAVIVLTAEEAFTQAIKAAEDRMAAAQESAQLALRVRQERLKDAAKLDGIRFHEYTEVNADAKSWVVTMPGVPVDAVPDKEGVVLPFPSKPEGADDEQV